MPLPFRKPPAGKHVRAAVSPGGQGGQFHFRSAGVVALVTTLLIAMTVGTTLPVAASTPAGAHQASSHQASSTQASSTQPSSVPQSGKAAAVRSGSPVRINDVAELNRLLNTPAPSKLSTSRRPSGRTSATVVPADGGGSCTNQGSSESCYFGFSGTDQHDGSSQPFVVPTGVTTLTADLYGASSAGASKYGSGGHVEVVIPNVYAGEQLDLLVAGYGTGTSGGWPDGGDASTSGANTGCAGGGGTRITFDGGSDIAEAGGGGGCGGGGDKAGTGGTAGRDAGSGTRGGGDCPGNGGAGATVGGPGGGGSGWSGSCDGLIGSGAGDGSGGSGHQGGSSGAGNTSLCCNHGYSGGGGGGGWYGGGGGGGGGHYGGGGGAGGGGLDGWDASLVTSPVSEPDKNPNGGYATVSYALQSTTTNLTVTPSSPSTVGGSVTLSATVTEDDGTPVDAGTVTFSGAAGICGPVDVGTSGTDQGVATCSFATTAVADNTITASYAQDGAYNGSTSTGEDLDVGKITTQISITGYSPSGTAATVTAAVTKSGQPWGTLDGTVQISAGGSTTSCSFEVSQASSCLLQSLTPGTAYTVTAAYQATALTAGASTSAAETQPKVSTTTKLSAANGGVWGDPIVFNSVEVDTLAPELAQQVQIFEGPNSGSAVGAVQICAASLIASAPGKYVTASGSLSGCSAPTTPGITFLYAVYPGDAETTSSQSSGHEYKTTEAATQLVLTATAGGQPLSPPIASNTPITLTATPTYTTTALSGAPVSPATITFTDNGAALTCDTLSVTTTATSCTYAPRIKDGTPQVFRAHLAAISGKAAAADQLNPVSVALEAPLTTLDFSPVPPSTVVAGATVELTVKLTSADPDAGVGVVNFYDASDKQDPICAAVPLTALTASCAAHPAPGSTVSYFATYTNDPFVFVEVDSSTTPTVIVGAAGSSTTVQAVTDSTFGDSVTLGATVTSDVTTPRAQPQGTVTFTQGSTFLCSAAVTATSTSGAASASCSTTALTAGADTVTATFTVPVGAPTTGSSGTGAAQVAAVTTSFTKVAASPATDTTATVSFTVGAGLTAAPSGTVTVTLGGATVCAAVTLNSGTGSCTVPLPAAAGTYTYGLAYTPDIANFASSSSTVDLVVGDVNVLCTGGTEALYQRMQAASGAFDASELPWASVSGTATVPAKCTAASVISFTASATLFNAVTATVSGVLTQANGLCITSTTFGPVAGNSWLPSGFSGQVCFSLSATGIIAGITSGSLTASGKSVPLLNLGGLGSVDLTLTFGHTAGEPATLVLSSTVDSSSGPDATLNGSVAQDGSASLTLTTAGLTLFGASLDLGGSITRTAGGAVTYSATATLPGPLTPPGAPGLSVSNVGVTLDNDGLHLTGTAGLGATGNGLAISLAADISSVAKWTLSLTTTGSAWTPISGLAISSALTGTISYDATQTDPYAYDFTGGDDSQPFVTWTTQGGSTVTVTKVELSSTASCGTASAGDPVLSLDGSATAGNTASFAVHVAGCVDLATSTFDLTGTASNLTIVSGLTLTALSVHVYGSNVAATLDGTATATVDSAGTSLAVPMKIKVSTGTGKSLVIGGAVDLTSLGLPAVGYVAYASAPVAAYDTGLTISQLPSGTQVSLARGLNAQGVITLDSQTSSDLTTLGVTAGATLSFSAALSSASSASFQLALNIPTLAFYKLNVTDLSVTASFTRANGQNTFHVQLTATVPAESGNATLAIDLDYDAAHTLTGTGSLTGVSFFGHPISLTGIFTHTAGHLTGTLTLAPTTLSIPLPAGATVTITNFTATVGTGGLSMAGTVAVPGAPTGLTITATLQNLRNYAVNVSGTLTGWSPTPGVSIAANTAISGTLASATAAGGKTSTYTLDLRASGTLFSLTPVSAVSLAVTSIELSNGAPSGCTVTHAGDLWLGVTGTVSVTVGSTASVAITGCLDINTAAVSLSAALPLTYTAPGGNVSIHNVAVTFSRSGSTFTVLATATLTIAFGQPFDVSATVQFVGGAFLIGAGIDLSKYLGAGGVAAAYIFFASAAITNVPTDLVGNFGNQDFAEGVTILGKVNIPDALATWLSARGVHVPGGSSLIAKGVLDLANKSVTLDIEVDLGADGQKLFDDGKGTSLALDSGALELSISPTLVSFGVRVDATLTVAPPTSDACNSTDNTVGLTGLVSLTGDTVTASFTVSHWQNALGICGLTIGEFTVQLGIDAEGIPNLGFVVQIGSLPTKLAEVIGYQPGTNLKLAVNISVDNFLVDIEIGTKGSTTAALKPLTIVGQPDLLVVNYAQLYISPNGAKVGTTVYPAGYALIFNASINGVALNFDLEVNPVKLSLYFDASLGQITIGSLTFGPTEIKLQAQASPFIFDFEFKGQIHLGPGTVDVGPLLRFSGYLDAAVDVSLGTSGFSASITADASVQGSNYLPQSTCWYEGFLPYPCDYEWVDDAPLTIPQFTASISINADGIDLQVPGITQTIHLPFSSNHVADAAYVTGSASTGSGSYTGGASEASGVYDLGASSAGHVSAANLAVAAPYPAGSTDPAVVVPASGDLAVSPRAQDYPAGSIDAAVALTASGNDQIVGRSAGDVVVAASLERRLTAYAATSQEAVPAAVVSPPPVVNPLPVTTSPATTAWVTGSWRTSVPARIALAFAMTSTLRNGDVLIAGGTDGHVALSSSKIYHPASGSWSTTGSMNTARVGAATVPLADGRVLVIGGANSAGVLASAEIYSPTTGTWQSAGALTQAREYPVAVRLADGRVLVTGGRGTGNTALSSSEIFDPSDGTWASAASMSTGRQIANAVQLPSGEVLVAGGLGTSGPLKSSELFSPATGNWSPTGSMNDARFAANGTLLSDGTVLESGDSAYSEIYYPALGTWKRTGIQHSPRTFQAAAQTPDGGVVTVGGFTGTVGSANAIPQSSNDVEYYDTATHLWSVLPDLPSAVSGASAIALNNGNVLVVGGLSDGQAQSVSYELVPHTVPSGNEPLPPGNNLPNTGVPASSGWIILNTALVMLLGAVLVTLGRRRRSISSAGASEGKFTSRD